MLTTQCVLFPTVGSSDSSEGEDLIEDDEKGFSRREMREQEDNEKGEQENMEGEIQPHTVWLAPQPPYPGRAVLTPR